MVDEVIIPAGSTAPATPTLPGSVVAEPATPLPGTDQPAVEGKAVVTDPVIDPTKTQDPNPQPDTVIEYTDFATPEGIEINQDLLSTFKDTSKNLKLNQEQAQAFIDLGVKQVQAIADSYTQREIAKINAWVDAAKHDPEYGGDKFQENVGISVKAIDAFGGEALKEALNTTGLGNHPEVIRAFYKIGLQISEDRFVSGGGKPSDEGKTWQQKLYPNLK